MCESSLLYDLVSDLQLVGLVPFEIIDTPKELKSGHLNKYLFFKTGDNEKYMLRWKNPIGRTTEEPIIENEYENVGFLKRNKYRFRSPIEQANYSKYLRHNNVCVPSVLFANDQVQIIHYVDDAIRLSDFWEKDDPLAGEKTWLILSYLKNLHSRQIIVGDRWGPNELLFGPKKNRVMLVDFDIELVGPEAKEI